MRDKEWVWRPLPRSILSSLHEPAVDPRDGHGAYSKLDLMILRKWSVARKGDDGTLIWLVKLIVRTNLPEVKSARDMAEVTTTPARIEIRSIARAMAALRMIELETVPVPLEEDGYAKVSSRQRIRFEPWFEEYALGRDGLDPGIVAGVRDWIANGSLQRPDLGDFCT